MKYLALTSGDAGILVEANSWDEVKHKLLKNIKKTALYQTIKVVNLKDASSKHYMVTGSTTPSASTYANMNGGGTKDNLYNIATQLNDTTRKLIEVINLDNSMEGGSDEETKDNTPKEKSLSDVISKQIKEQTTLPDQPSACAIM